MARKVTRIELVRFGIGSVFAIIKPQLHSEYNSNLSLTNSLLE